MSNRKTVAMGLAIASSLATAAAYTPALAETGVKVGTLTCELVDSSNVVVYKNETFECLYNPNNLRNETYTGQITRIGVDLTIKRGQSLIWTVIAPTTELNDFALEGTYGGVTAEAAVVAGVGGKVLVGGFEKSITLQPLAVAGMEGAGAAVGIETFELKAK